MVSVGYEAYGVGIQPGSFAATVKASRVLPRPQKVGKIMAQSL